MSSEIMYIVGIICFVLLVVTIVTLIVVKHGKPTIINYGTIHNHYYGKDSEEKPKSVNGETASLLAEGFVEALKAINSGKETNRAPRNRTLKK